MRAIDSKHLAIRRPKNGGSLYYNYKGFHSIILLALVDANYKFLWVDVGTNGSSSDAQIFNDCDLCLGIVDGTCLMKPFSTRGLPDEERILSHARRVVENASWQTDLVVFSPP